MRITSQKEIAKRLGISVSLVSRALSGTAPRIGASPLTIKKIQDEARRLNYAPDLAALSLRGSRSSTIAAIIKDFDDPFFGSMMDQIRLFARKRSLSLFLSSVPESNFDIAMLERLRPNMLLICGSGVCSTWTHKLISKGLDCIQIGRDKIIPGLKRVYVDDDCGMELLLEHFLSFGHRNFLFIGTKSFSHKSRFKFLLKKIVSAKGKNLTIKKTRFADNYAKIANELAKFFAKKSEITPSAIIAGDDLAAIESLSFLKQKNISVPDHVSIAGFDNIYLASKFSPPLTSIGLSMEKITETAFKLAGKRIRPNECLQIPLKPEIFIRGSIKNIKKEI